MKIGKNKKKKEEEKAASIVGHLVEFGLTPEDAKSLAGQLEKYKEISQDGTGSLQGGESSKNFEEKTARDINIEGQARMDMARFLLDINPDDIIEKKIAMSEIPAPSLMHLTMSKTLDDLCKTGSNGTKKLSPIEIFLSNYTTFMRGLNRKSRKEGLQIFETDVEKGKEGAGLFPPSLKG